MDNILNRDSPISFFFTIKPQLQGETMEGRSTTTIPLPI